MKTKIKMLIAAFGTLLLIGCFDNNEAQAKNANSIKLGEESFNKNCVLCHGKQAKGLVENWKQALPNGTYPAPPLNGSAHTWHHSPKLLLNTINNGGEKFGGTMPGFKNKLSQVQKLAILDYLHSLWPKDIQQKYDRRFK